MIEVTNKSKSPVQLIIRSRRGPSPRAFTTLVVPGIGSKKNVALYEDERHTEYVDRVEKDFKLISVRRIPNKK